MCGATSQQTTTYNEQQAFYQQAMQEQAAAYGEDQDILSQMQKVYSPIFTAGPSQEGFSPEEKAALQSGVTDTTAADYQQAQQAVGESMAAEGGGNIVIPNAAAASIKGQIATSAASQEAQQRNQITSADWQQGYQNWLNAASGMMGVSGQVNPLGYSEAATGAGSAAGTTANQIAQESNSWINAALGAAGAIGSGVIGENPGGIFGG